MKQILLIFLMTISLKNFAQTPITLTRADFPKPTTSSTLPDSVLYTNVVGATTTAQDLNGASQIWNEWALTGTTAFQSFVPMTSTPLIFQLAFLSCDFAQPLTNAGNIGGATATDAFEYYDYTSSNSKLQIKGFGANILAPGTTTSIPTPAIYSSPDVVYVFPIVFGNIDSSTSSFDISLPLPAPIGNVQVKRNQTRHNEVDAWGSVTTPAGTFDVLRVTSKIDRIDSIIMSTFSFGTPTNPVEYKWLGQGKKIPVLQINGNDVAGTFTPTTVTFWGESQIPANVNSINSNLSSILVSPNPVINDAKIDFSLKKEAMVNIDVLSVFGQKVAEFHFKKQAGNYSEILPLQQLQNGIYIINLASGKNRFSSKIVKL